MLSDLPNFMSILSCGFLGVCVCVCVCVWTLDAQGGKGKGNERVQKVLFVLPWPAVTWVLHLGAESHLFALRGIHLSHMSQNKHKK